MLALDLAQRLEEAFGKSAGHGLLRLGAGEVGAVLPSALAYWRDFAARYITALCTQSGPEERREFAPVAAPPPGELERLAQAVPPMPGAEYLCGAVLGVFWDELGRALGAELADSRTSLQDFLKRLRRSRLAGAAHREPQRARQSRQ